VARHRHQAQEEEEVSTAYRCDKCGQFREGASLRVEWYPPEDAICDGDEIDLCPDCAPAVIEPLAEIAKTTYKDAT
jgi:hypothetical protein